MVRWALDCAERVLPRFEAVAPHDSRPREAIETGRAWVATGSFSMKAIRGASLSAHAAAKDVKAFASACHAAHAAGQAVAAAHVPQHAYGGAYYALRAVASSSQEGGLTRVQAELDWQTSQLPAHLRDQLSKHFTIREERSAIKVTITKGPDF
jgi:hypothetical protein